jgi:hypothetical protein
LVQSEYRYAVPNRQLKLTPQQILLQQTVKIALLNGLLHQSDSRDKLRSSKGRVRANNSAGTNSAAPSAAPNTAPNTEKSASDKPASAVPAKASEASEPEPVDEKALLSKLLLDPAPTVTPATAPTSTPVPVTAAQPSTSIAVPATPTSTPVVTAPSTALLVPNSALGATLMKEMALKGKTGGNLPLTAVTLLHSTQLTGANVCLYMAIT